MSSANNFHYVYILESDAAPGKHYTGLTTDLEERLRQHNTGHCRHTSKYLPWHIEVAVAFRSRDMALAFEKYLKSHSGRAFSSRHF